MKLVTPSKHYFDSFSESVKEWGGRHQDGAGIRDYSSISTLAGFEHWIELLRAEEREPQSKDFVTCSYYWITCGDEYLGAISLRHELNNYLEMFGGHVGYSLRPSARGQGYATRALAELLKIAAERGTEKLLVTCSSDNLASIQVISRNGGQFDGEREDDNGTVFHRYWLETGRPRRTGLMHV